MQCTKCSEIKLSNEFPSPSSCKHSSDFCLKCLLDHYSTNISCPQCKVPVDIKTVLLLENDYKRCYSSVHLLRTRTEEVPVVAQSSGTLTVVNIHGDRFTVPFEDKDTLFSLKKRIQEKTNVRPDLQRLIFNKKQIEDDNSILSTLGFYDKCVVRLVVLLFDFSKTNIRQVIFDLNWGFPDIGADYLDATCFLYGKGKFIILDYSNKTCKGVKHSGDIMDQKKLIGHHKITVDLGDILECITHVYFVLSAWNSPTIGKFKNPTVRLYDCSKPEKEICEYAIEQAGKTQSVIMCCLVRCDGGWVVERHGVFSAGNAKDYTQIKNTIQKLHTKK